MSDKFVILLVEDNSADVRLTQEALINGKVFHELYIVSDGIEAMKYLRHEPPFHNAPEPDLILLDLNLPRMDGREVLTAIKEDPALARIPVVILTSSQADDDILKTYDLHANGYIVKPVEVEQFFAAIKGLKEFWMSIVLLPPKDIK